MLPNLPATTSVAKTPIDPPAIPKLPTRPLADPAPQFLKDEPDTAPKPQTRPVGAWDAGPG
jgi:hypothetical protein